jgi:ribonuclease P protein component
LPHVVIAADFERALAARSRAATPHFAIHYVAASPSGTSMSSVGPSAAELSTIGACNVALPVEDSFSAGLPAARSWIGAVVPKRHARRAVTRSLLKRQIYAAADRQRARLAPGLWIVRLRAPFDRASFASAASLALRRSARAELDALLAAAVASSRP